MSKEQIAEKAFYAQPSYRGSHKDSFVKGYTTALEHHEKRVAECKALLRECRDEIKRSLCWDHPEKRIVIMIEKINALIG